MILETKRLILRPWHVEDAHTLYEYAKDERVGPITGWPVHTSVENSRDIIVNVLSVPQTYAVVEKATGTMMGSISLMIGKQSQLGIKDDEAEVGFWLGVPHWGHGYIPEATLELIHYGFCELGIKNMWCGYYDGNEKSQRAQEKCGFLYHHTNKNVLCKLMNETRTEHISFLSKETWEKTVS